MTGHDEYVRHAENGVVADWDDLPGTAAWLDLLARDRELLRRLRTGALETARAWPSLDASAAMMAAALEEIAHEPHPNGVPAARRLLADAEAAMEELRRATAEAGRRTQAGQDRIADLEQQLNQVPTALWEPEGSRLIHLRSALRRLLASIRR